jgi:hypothetical protein
MKIYYNIDSQFLLIKAVFGKEIGFSQYHEIKSLDYPNVSEILSLIKLRKRHFLITNAYLDAFEFSKQYIKGDLSFKNHSLFYQKELYRFSNILKLKLTGSLEQDIKLILKYEKQFGKLRLDCNNKYSPESFNLLVKSINKDHIEYIEDPFPFDRRLYSQLGLPIAVDHRYNLDLNREDFKDFRIIFRPTINPNDPRAFESIFSNQFEGLLGAWHSFCYLKKMGDINRIQGIYNPFTPELYIKNKNSISLNKKVIENEYKNLRSLKWTKLKL